MKKALIVMVSIFILGGCASRVMYMPFKETPRISEKDIKILSQHPQEPYKTLGVIEIEGHAWSTKDGMLNLIGAHELRYNQNFAKVYSNQLSLILLLLKTPHQLELHHNQ